MTLERIVEALLLASPEPLDERQLLALLTDDGVDRRELEAVLVRLAGECEGRPLELVRVASGWRYQIRREFAPWIARLFPQKAGRYSRAVLETLAIIAYCQPVTRGEIEAIRGVTVGSQIIRTLEAREWIRVVGHKNVPGRPALYATTKKFLDDFNLESLEQLPPLTCDDEPNESEKDESPIRAAG